MSHDHQADHQNRNGFFIAENEAEAGAKMAPPALQLMASADAPPPPNPFQQVAQLQEDGQGQAQIPPAAATALLTHRQAIRRISTTLAAMRQQDANGNPVDATAFSAAQWFAAPGGGTGHPILQLVVMTPTHDDALRAQNLGFAGGSAYFGKGDFFPESGADYDFTDARSDRNVVTAAADAVWERHGNAIYLFRMHARTQQSLQALLTGIVTQQAQHFELDPDQQAEDGTPGREWMRYKELYHLYVGSGRFSARSNSNDPKLAPYQNAQQRAIARHIFRRNPGIRAQYNANLLVRGDSFRNLVHEYQGNDYINSDLNPVFERFIQALQVCDPAQATPGAAINHMLTLLFSMDTAYRDEINDTVKLQEEIKDHCHPKILKIIEQHADFNGADWLTYNYSATARALPGMRRDQRGQVLTNLLETGSQSQEWAFLDDARMQDAVYDGTTAQDRDLIVLIESFGARRTWPAFLNTFAVALGQSENAMLDAFITFTDPERQQLLNSIRAMRLIRLHYDEAGLFSAILVLTHGNRAVFTHGIEQLLRVMRTQRGDNKALLEAMKNVEAAAMRNLPTEAREVLVEMASNRKADHDVADTLSKGNYQTAIANHLQNEQMIYGAIRSMKTSANVVEQNTHDWLRPDDAGVPRHVEFWVLTRTHDAVDRANHHGHSGESAWFGRAIHQNEGSMDYDPAIESTRDIVFESVRGGDATATTVRMYDGHTRSRQSNINIIVHEIQHVVDRHHDEPGENHMDTPATAWTSYKTEFRAYWIDGDFDRHSDAPQQRTDGFKNARQRAIFDHMYGSHLYSYLQQPYDHGATVYGLDFRDLVHNYDRPEGINLINSPVIDAFYLELRKCNHRHTDLNAAPLDNLRKAALRIRLNNPVLNYLLGAHALRFYEELQQHLNPAMYRFFIEFMLLDPPAAFVPQNRGGLRNRIADMLNEPNRNQRYQTVSNAITNASADDLVAMRQDIGIREALYRGFQGQQQWLVFLELEFGGLANVPAFLRTMATGNLLGPRMQQRINQGLAGLNAEQLAALGRVPGFKRLADHRGNANVWNTERQAPVAYAQALRNHRTAARNLQQALRLGRQLPNAAHRRYFDHFATEPEAQIDLFTSTHDSALRASHNGETNNAYFGGPMPGAAHLVYSYDRFDKNDVSFLDPNNLDQSEFWTKLLDVHHMNPRALVQHLIGIWSQLSWW